MRWGLLIALWISSISLAEVPKMDRFGEPLPDGAIARLGMFRHQRDSGHPSHCGPVISADGKTLATTNGPFVLLWDVKSTKVIRRLEAPAASALAFGPKETFLALSYNASTWHPILIRWSLRTGKQLSSFEIPHQRRSATFSHAGRLLVTTSKKGLHLWDCDSSKELWQIETHADSMVFSRDDSLLACGRHERLKPGYRTALMTLDVKTGKSLGKDRWLEDRVQLFDLSPDGKTVLGVSNVQKNDPHRMINRIRFYEVETGKLLRTYAEMETSYPRGLIFSPDGKQVASVDPEQRIAVWDRATGKKLRAFENEHYFIQRLVFSPDGSLLINGDGYGSVYFNDLKTGAVKHLNPSHAHNVLCLAFSEDGNRLASGGYVSRVVVWDMETMQARSAFLLPDRGSHLGRGIPYQLAFTPDRKSLLIRSHPFRTALYGLPSGKRITSFENCGWVYGFSDDGRRLLWAGRELDTMPRHPSHSNYVTPTDPKIWLQLFALIKRAAHHPELGQFRFQPYFSLPKKHKPKFALGGMVAQGDRYAVKGLSPSGRILIETVLVPTGQPFTGMGMYLVHNGYRLSDMETGRELLRIPEPEQRTLLGQASLLTPPHFAPDERSYAACAKKEKGPVELQLRELHGGGLRLRIGQALNHSAPLAFSPEGRWLVFVDEKGQLAISDLLFGRVVHHLRPESPARSLTFSPDGKRLVSGLSDGTILIWDVTRFPKKKPTEVTWSEAERERLWKRMAEDAKTAYRAMMEMRRSPESAVRLLTEKMLVEDRAKTIRKWIEDLDSRTFAVRQEATKQLQAQGELARAELLQVLQAKPTLEKRRRIESLLDGLKKPFSTPAGLRQLRVVEVLDYLRTPAARELLKQLTRLGSDKPLAREARRSLESNRVSPPQR